MRGVIVEAVPVIWWILIYNWYNDIDSSVNFYLLHGADFFWRSYQFSASQEIPRIVWKPKVHYRIHQCPLPILLIIQRTSPNPRHLYPFRDKASFDGEELLVLRLTPKLDDHSVSAVRNCLFNIFVVTLHIGGRSSILNLRTRHAVVTGTHLSGAVLILTLLL